MDCFATDLQPYISYGDSTLQRIYRNDNKYTEYHCMQKGCVHYICNGFSAKSTITDIASLIRFCGSKFPEQICSITHRHGTLKTTSISFSDSYVPLTFMPTECSSTGDSILQQIPNVMHRGEHSL